MQIDFLHTNFVLRYQKRTRYGSEPAHCILTRADLADSAFKLAPHGYGIDVIHSGFRIALITEPRGELTALTSGDSLARYC